MRCPISLAASSLALIALLAGGTSSAATDTQKARKPSAQKASKPTAGKRAASAQPRTAAAPARTGPLYATRDDAMRFADDLAMRRDLDREWVRATIGRARMLPNVPRLMLPPAKGTPKNWRAYRGRFIDPVRIAAGVRFWRANASTLARAEAEFGVPADIIVGIIGVETIYGQNMGSFRVIDALATLAFDFPQAHPRAADRQAFFRDELENFLTLTNRTAADPMAALGSYAGAMGMPQFMPSSIIKYAIDYDGNGRIDLVNDTADVIGSVANYFRAFNWQPGMPAVYPVHFGPGGADLDGLLAPDILPTFSAANFEAKGALLDSQGRRHTGPLALIELQNGAEAPTYVAGTENFYAITRYNWSSYYAMSVLELGREVRAAMEP